MLTPLTAAKIDAALLELELLQRPGCYRCKWMLQAASNREVPAPGEPCVLAWLAAKAGVAEGTICAVQRIALVKVARTLRGGDLPPHLAKAVCHLIDDPQQPELF